MRLPEIESTREIFVPTDPIERVIGQKTAVEKVKLAIIQRRHLLLVGPPGIGKSMLAQALALHLRKPRFQVSILPNPTNSHKPVVEVLTREELERERNTISTGFGQMLTPKDVPSFVAERLGFRCTLCGELSDYKERICPKCGANKYSRIMPEGRQSPFTDIITDVFDVQGGTPEPEIQTTHIRKDGVEELVIYQRLENQRIRILNQDAIVEMQKLRDKRIKNVIVPVDRSMFVHATGASETELLGDVRHDPYGSHPEIGTPAYLRVVPGAIHEAHEGVLFIDELPHLGNLQNFILTAMQERKFPITGRNPQSAGASVKVEDVPCDFIFVGACNIRDVGIILPPLRSRIIGNGYEMLLDTTMPDTPENRMRLTQFVAQEIISDGRIPHAKIKAVERIIEEARKRAKEIDETRDALTLRLRDLGGVIRMAGDYAVSDGSEFIEEKHIVKSISESKSIERQLKERYGSVWKGMEKDSSYVSEPEQDRSYL